MATKIKHTNGTNLVFLELLFTTIQSNSHHINSKSDNKRHHKDRTRGSVKKGPWDAKKSIAKRSSTRPRSQLPEVGLQSLFGHLTIIHEEKLTNFRRIRLGALFLSFHKRRREFARWCHGQSGRWAASIRCRRVCHHSPRVSDTSVKEFGNAERSVIDQPVPACVALHLRAY